ncbi:hypothetical protein AOLI_G00320910 [Acnodon oligacanthus]
MEGLGGPGVPLVEKRSEGLAQGSRCGPCSVRWGSARGLSIRARGRLGFPVHELSSIRAYSGQPGAEQTHQRRARQQGERSAARDGGPKATRLKRLQLKAPFMHGDLAPARRYTNSPDCSSASARPAGCAHAHIRDAGAAQPSHPSHSCASRRLHTGAQH